jgi:hypothetical protein
MLGHQQQQQHAQKEKKWRQWRSDETMMTCNRCTLHQWLTTLQAPKNASCKAASSSREAPSTQRCFPFQASPRVSPAQRVQWIGDSYAVLKKWMVPRDGDTTNNIAACFVLVSWIDGSWWCTIFRCTFKLTWRWWWQKWCQFYFSLTSFLFRLFQQPPM